MTKDKWYAVRLVIELRIDEGERTTTSRFEDQIMVVRSSDDQSASVKAEEFARARETTYSNADGETVSWIFREVVDVTDIDDAEIQDGTEIYSAFIDEGLVESLRNFVPSPLEEFRSSYPDLDVLETRADDVLKSLGDEDRDLPHP